MRGRGGGAHAPAEPVQPGVTGEARDAGETEATLWSLSNKAKTQGFEGLPAVLSQGAARTRRPSGTLHRSPSPSRDVRPRVETFSRGKGATASGEERPGCCLTPGSAGRRCSGAPCRQDRDGQTRSPPP